MNYDDPFDLDADIWKPTTERYAFEFETKVDFSRVESARDIMSAEACIEVFTSDGEKGTINHLLHNIDPVEFASDLKNRIGTENVSVCLAGGWIKFPNSITLGKKLLDELKAVGFKIGETDLGGNSSRLGTIYKDRVEIEKTDLSSKARTTQILKF